jgi:hypothetical protein
VSLVFTYRSRKPSEGAVLAAVPEPATPEHVEADSLLVHIELLRRGMELIEGLYQVVT